MFDENDYEILNFYPTNTNYYCCYDTQTGRKLYEKVVGIVKISDARWCTPDSYYPKIRWLVAIIADDGSIAPGDVSPYGVNFRLVEKGASND